jgi:ORF6N domain-containing protein
MSDLIPIERIESKILVIRGERVLLDRDLAELYGVEPRRLRERVRRNIERFPADFMMQLTEEEVDSMVTQFASPSRQSFGGHLPYVFTQEGIAMLSSVLRSPQAIAINIQIMRVFVQIRRMILKDELINARLEDLEDRLGTQEFQTLAVLDQLGAIRGKLKPQKSNKPLIGFPMSGKDD